MGYKFDMDMGSRISPPISRFLVFFMAYALATDAPAFPNTFSGDRTVSDLSLALISRLSDAQSNIRASPRYCANPLFKRIYKNLNALCERFFNQYNIKEKHGLFIVNYY